MNPYGAFFEDLLDAESFVVCVVGEGQDGGRAVNPAHTAAATATANSLDQATKYLRILGKVSPCSMINEKFFLFGAC